MKMIVLFDPSIRSFNKGDEIIMRSAERELDKAGILEGNYTLKTGTHSPAITLLQSIMRRRYFPAYEKVDYKFICGSNLLFKNMLCPCPSLNVNLLNCSPYKDSVLMGVGMGRVDRRTDLYTKILYKKILSSEYIHSARDQATVDFLEALGYRAINTGCPTMWGFDKTFCATIPVRKGKKVVFTLTDYVKDIEADQKMIDCLIREYNEVFFWIQGPSDFEYLQQFKNIQSIKIVSPSLDDYESVLSNDEIDYVGTRLHAGLFAIQHRKRTIIICVDNRARDISKDYNLNIIERDSIDSLASMINSELETDVKINTENINKWINQFV